jgi:hypothetical protein
VCKIRKLSRAEKDGSGQVRLGGKGAKKDRDRKGRYSCLQQQTMNNIQLRKRKRGEGSRKPWRVELDGNIIK